MCLIVIPLCCGRQSEIVGLCRMYSWTGQRYRYILTYGIRSAVISISLRQYTLQSKHIHVKFEKESSFRTLKGNDSHTGTSCVTSTLFVEFGSINRFQALTWEFWLCTLYMPFQNGGWEAAPHMLFEPGKISRSARCHKHSNANQTKCQSFNTRYKRGEESLLLKAGKGMYQRCQNIRERRKRNMLNLIIRLHCSFSYQKSSKGWTSNNTKTQRSSNVLMGLWDEVRLTTMAKMARQRGLASKTCTILGQKSYFDCWF